ncbi:MAG: N-acetyl-gamma-glutamyl-phosphate reductase [Bacteroidales bacterium]|nr:N-acetyl-gamma-glutamyl-phosphate reductase [Bacteroidales bacterium]MDD4436329.1 N-acetyl-gamma-glutamyl-phosphate reductase [Bacteroidales bacterium]
MNNKIRTAVAGGAGYTGGELIRLLLHHPNVEITGITSRSRAGEAVTRVHRDLAGETGIVFDKTLPRQEIDVLFLCLGHGRSRQFIQDNDLEQVRHIIDLSNDFRFSDTNREGQRQFVYGMPESYPDPATYAQKAKAFGNVANPGCFASAIELALIPLARAKWLQEDIHVHAITGATGAGARLSETSHFPYRNNNLSVYKAFRHQHTGEIRETLSIAMEAEIPQLHFVPIRGDFSRGILASTYTSCNRNQVEVVDLYRNYYAAHPFVHISENELSMKDVVNTNKCLIHIEKHGHMLHITSVLDNLLKGASGTALQNMNLITGLPQTTGLQLKSIVY